MKIYLTYNHPLIRKEIKKQNEEINFGESFTINDLLCFLNQKYKLKNLLIDNTNKEKKFTLLVNGTSIKDSSYKLKDKDRVNILLLATGG